MLNGFILGRKVEDYLKTKRRASQAASIESQREGAQAQMLENYRVRVERFIADVLRRCDFLR